MLLEESNVPALPIENETALLGDPVYPLFVALRVSIDAGQYQSFATPDKHDAIMDVGAGKKRPFEPVSMKLEYVVVLKTVIISALLSAG